MVNIQGNFITLTRGDTLKIKINITDVSGVPYVPIAEDKIRFALKERYTDAKPILLKEIPFDTLQLLLTSQETKSLVKSDYVYDIQITLTDGTVDTFIPNGRLRLTEEVD